MIKLSTILKEIQILTPKPVLYKTDYRGKTHLLNIDNYDVYGNLSKDDGDFTISFNSNEEEEYEIQEFLTKLKIPFEIDHDGEYDDGWRGYTYFRIDNASKYFNIEGGLNEIEVKPYNPFIVGNKFQIGKHIWKLYKNGGGNGVGSFYYLLNLDTGETTNMDKEELISKIKSKKIIPIK